MNRKAEDRTAYLSNTNLLTVHSHKSYKEVTNTQHILITKL